MATMMRVMTTWMGWSGAPGYTASYFGAGGASLLDAAVDYRKRVREANAGLGALLPNDVQLRVSEEVQLIDDLTGELTGIINESTVSAAVNGIGGANFSAPAGMSVTFRTEGIRAGRRVRGRHFLVPLAASAFDSAGTLTAVAQSYGTTYTTRLRTVIDQNSQSGPLVVWARPRPGLPGASYEVESGSTSDRASILRSRRA